MDKELREIVEGSIRAVFTSCKQLSSRVSESSGGVIQLPFTPDGRMVGDIGEALAGLLFDIELDSRRYWDARYQDEDIQIKTTSREETYLKEPPHEGRLIVVQVHPDGTWRIIYNGSIMKVWNAMGGKGAERSITLKKLAEHQNGEVPIPERCISR